MKVLVETDFHELENEREQMVPGITVTCSRCGNSQESFGQTDKSVNRCIMLLKESCPKGEKNYYAVNEGAVASAPLRGSPKAVVTVTAPTGQSIAPGLFGTPTTPAHLLGGPGLVGLGASPATNTGGGKKFSVPGRGRVRTPTETGTMAVAVAGVVGVAVPRPGAPTGAAMPRITTGSIPRLIAENNFCVIKVATTGLSTEKDEVCQIGLVQVDGGRARFRLSVNVKPSFPMPQKAGEIHGLTDEKLYFAPSFANIAPDIGGLIGDRILLGYNISKFDRPMLERQFQAAGVAAPLDHLDVLLFERKYAQDSSFTDDSHRHGLGAALRRWGVPMAVTYDALNDARAVWAVFVALCQQFPELGEATLAEALDILKAEGEQS